tara:strand:- start:216 stop:509 length:294 start_codon:yes stop_codon:yes gene_type:complete
MKLTKLEIYIGHNNKTKKRISEAKLIKFLDSKFKGYTIYKTKGLYKGTPELSYKIEYIKFDYKMLTGIRYFKNIKKEMELEFKQEEILFLTSEVNTI